MNIQTADLCDQFEADVRVCVPMFRSYGGRKAFGGEIVTLKLHEDNGLVRKALEAQGKGRVLVVDGGGSMRRALVGDQIAQLAATNGFRLHTRLIRHRTDGHRRVRTGYAPHEDREAQRGTM
jgi:regulator of ribonuclease activity A